MTVTGQRSCPAPDALSSFVDGALPSERRAELIAHVSHCANCRFVIEAVMEAEEGVANALAAYVPKPAVENRFRMVAALAAALAAVFAVMFYVMHFTDKNQALAELAAAMPRSARLVEPRITGDFPWAPLRDVRRGDASTSAEELIVTAAAGKALREVTSTGDPEDLHTAGVAYLLQGDTSRAVEALTKLTGRQPGDSRSLNDLAAALYTDATKRDDRAMLSLALETANSALAIDPASAAARFNRALILERVGDVRQAQWAWNSYLAVDSRTGWATEAREHLGRLRAASTSSVR